MDPPYTILYVDSTSTLEKLFNEVAYAVEGTIRRGTVFSKCVEVDVRVNEYFEQRIIDRDPGDFIHYAYTVEVEANEGVSLDYYLEAVSSLMRCLHAKDVNVVAACDWEDKLPGSGKLGKAFATSS